MAQAAKSSDSKEHFKREELQSSDSKEHFKREELQSPENPSPSTYQEKINAIDKLKIINEHKNSCREVLEKLKTSFSDYATEPHHRVQAWRDQMDTLEKALDFGEITIAVVGQTGSGKSSLLNALADHFDVLPTSGSDACTSVVVEVMQNIPSKSNFEADIEFLTEEEWFDELKLLVQDVIWEDGKLEPYSGKLEPDSESSHSKIITVYDKIDTFQNLSQDTKITDLLGTTKHIENIDKDEFRSDIEMYITSTSRHWPIIKQVRIRIPECVVCSSDVVLVDLPGVNDSNLARGAIAEKYLYKSNALWVVSDIIRAKDEKIASDLLQQLHMDGHDGNIAFICTKTDSLNNTEIIRERKLRNNDTVKRLQENIQQAKKECSSTQIVKDIATDQRELNTFCAKARNMHSKTQIKESFKKMKQRAGLFKEDELEEGLAQLDDGSLQVFCCSSTDYQKQKNQVDEPPVFSNVEDTEIPALRNYVHEMASALRCRSLESLIRGIGSFVFNLKSYIEVKDKQDRNVIIKSIKDLLHTFKDTFEDNIKPTKCDLSKYIDETFNQRIHDKLVEGVASAKEAREITEGKYGDLNHKVYRAIMVHKGQYFSKRTGRIIDFNADLARPLIFSIVNVWHDVFIESEGTLSKKLDEVNEKIMEELKRTIAQLCKELEDRLEVPRDQSEKIGTQFICSAANELKESKFRLTTKITDHHQQTIRLVKPLIQKKMSEIYSECASYTGQGSFMRMKERMAKGIDTRKGTMFDEVKDDVMLHLKFLQKRIEDHIQEACDSLRKSINVAFEPLWETQDICEKPDFLKTVRDVCSTVRRIYEGAGLENTEEGQSNEAAPTFADMSEHSPLPLFKQEHDSDDGVMKSKKRKVDTDLSDGSSEKKVCLEDIKEKLENLLHLGLIPTQDDINTAAYSLGFKSPLLKSACDAVCNYIKQTSDRITTVWAAYRPGRAGIEFVICTKDKGNFEISEFKTYSRCCNDFSDESKTVNERQREIHFSKEDAVSLKRCIEDYSTELMAKHSNIGMISANHYKSKNFSCGKREYLAGACIVLYVYIKGLIPLQEDAFPERLGDFPIDVIEGGFSFCGKGSNEYHEKVRMGCQISVISQLGTIGPFIELPDGKTGFITCAHVVLTKEEMIKLFQAGDGSLVVCDRTIHQPSDDNAVGKVIKTLHKRGNARGQNGFEIAVVELQERNPDSGTFPNTNNTSHLEAGYDSISDMTYSTGDAITDACELVIGSDVLMFGSQSGICRGVLRLHGSVVRLKNPEFDVPNLVLHNQLEVIPATGDAQHGDSGAVVFSRVGTQPLRALGLLEGKGPTSTGYLIVSPIWNILKEVGCPLKRFPDAQIPMDTD